MSDLKQLERLYSHSYLSYIATFFAAVLVFWLFQNIAEANVLTNWFILFSILTVIRIIVSWYFNKSDHTDNMDIWLLAFVAMSMISGTLWGVTGFLLVPEGVLTLLDSVLYHGMLLLFIVALITGSIITYSTSRMVYLCFSVPAIIPQCLLLISKGDKYHSFLGGFVLAYACIIFVISNYIHRIFSECSKIEAENEILKEALDKNGIKVKNESG